MPEGTIDRINFRDSWESRRGTPEGHTSQKGTATARGLRRVWDLDVEILLSFPKSGKGVVSEQLKGAHFVSGEANALQSEVQLEGVVLSYIQLANKRRGQAATSGGSAFIKAWARWVLCLEARS